jgi:hypothetical protein
MDTSNSVCIFTNNLINGTIIDSTQPCETPGTYKSNTVSQESQIQVITYNWGQISDNTLNNASSIYIFSNEYTKTINKNNLSSSNLQGEANSGIIDYNNINSNSLLKFIANTGTIRYNEVSNNSELRTDYNNLGTVEKNIVTSGSLIRNTNNTSQILGNNCSSFSNLYVDNNNNKANGNSISNESNVTISTNNQNFYFNSINKSTVNINNSEQEFSYNNFTSNSDVNIDTLSDAITGCNVTNNGSINTDNNGNVSFAMVGCSISGQPIDASLFTQIQSSKTINAGYSNYVTDLDMLDPSIYDSGSQVLTLTSPQFGLVYLTNPNSNVISKIANLSYTRSSRFIVKITGGVDEYVTFQNTEFASASIGSLVCDAPNSANVLVGRGVGSDFTEYQKSQPGGAYVNLRTNLVKLA